MFRRCVGLWFNRPLSPLTLLETVRKDPGMTSAYYANRYFGEDKTVEVNHLFWNQLKRSGKVLLEREKESGEARWVPVVVTPKLHNVRHHKQEEEDLSYIKEEK